MRQSLDWKHLSIVVKNHGEELPSGENLEYESVYTALTLAAQPEEERQAGNEIVPGAEPDPKKLIQCAEAVLEQSNDIRAAVLYGYGAIRTQGFAGLAEVTGYVRACLEEYWDSAHPQLDEDDDDDPTMRVNAVIGLADTATVLKSARLAPLTQSQNFGRMSLRDLSIAEGEIDAPEDMDTPPTAQTVSAAFQDTPEEVLEAINAAIVQASDDIAGINAVFDEKLPGQGPNLDALVSLLKKARKAIGEYVGGADEEEAESEEDAGESAAGGSSRAATAAPGTISNSSDVQKALDRIMEYYAKNEPSSPLPILLKRARRLIGADFLTIMQDIAPAGVDNVKMIGGGDDE